MGSITKRGKTSWRLKVYAGKDPDTGRDRYLYRTVHARTKTEARSHLVAFAAEVQAHAERVGADRTMADLWAAYCDKVLWGRGAKPRSEGTRAEYERNWRLHVGPVLGEMPVASVTPPMLNDLYESLYVKPCAGSFANTGRVLSPATVQKCHKLISALLTKAVHWEWIAGPHAATRCDAPQVSERRVVRAPTPETVTLLLDAAQQRSPEDGLFYRLAAVTGARRGELSVIRWNDVDLDQGCVHIDEAAQTRLVKADGSRDRRLLLGDTKTLTSVRTVSIDAATCDLVREHRERVIGALGSEPGPTAYVFAADPEGRQFVDPQVWSTRWARLARRAGHPGVRLHDLRHFVGVTLGPIDLGLTMAQLGHSRLSTTGIYQARAFSSTASDTMAATIGQARSA